MKKILEGRTALGIEFGSTRIKAVLTDDMGEPVAEGGYGWENRFEDGIWTYSLEDIWTGLRAAYAELKQSIKEKYDITLTTVGSMGFSAMMHGYMAFGDDGRLLVPFRTWRNTITDEAARILTKEFGFNIPQRWSVAHLYQAILNGEEHVKDISFLTTLAGYIHWQLTGEKALGIGDASGMFPIDSGKRDYNEEYLDKFSDLIEEYNYPWHIRDILPKALVAGKQAGILTKDGALKLDPEGDLMEGIPLCPPEGDAGTGMTATKSVAIRTGNISAGTSIFAMVVMDKALGAVHEEIDVVTTPAGDDVAMVHCNNCTSDINAWIKIFREYSGLMGFKVDTNKLYETMFRAALSGAPDCGGLMGFNYFSGEPVTGFEEGRPVFARNINADFTFANFMRLNLYSAVSSLKYGLDILFKEEKVKVDKMYGHGGFFKTPEAGQRIMSAAIGEPVTVMKTAGEGGAWGIAVLALYMLKGDGKTLSQFLEEVVFSGEKGTEIMADAADVEGFNKFMESFKAAIPLERAAIDVLN